MHSPVSSGPKNKKIKTPPSAYANQSQENPGKEPGNLGLFGWSTCGQCAILLTHVILLIITSGVHPAGEGGESPDEEIYRVVPKY